MDAEQVVSAIKWTVIGVSWALVAGMFGRIILDGYEQYREESRKRMERLDGRK